ncbi:hypothetical protein EJ110_NYTH59975 [Nymphaea thermarum]|nr:hypothetical protein EJ110_NYTH59975 [Nymphaea thermarum]
MQEFLELQQNHMSLEEYITKYQHLEVYYPHLYTTDEARADKFVHGLRDGLRRFWWTRGNRLIRWLNSHSTREGTGSRSGPGSWGAGTEAGLSTLGGCSPLPPYNLTYVSHRSWRRAFFVDRSSWKLSSLNAVEVPASVFRLQPIHRLGIRAASGSAPPWDLSRLGIRAIASESAPP